MSRTPEVKRRSELLDELLDNVAAEGIGNRSLRELATSIGTSHRMLLHYFGSRDELLLSIVEEVERRQSSSMTDIPSDPAGAIAAIWANLRRRELRPLARLYFECFARAVQGEKPFTRLLPSALEGWLEPFNQDVDPSIARLGLAVMRGLLLDLIATGDEAAINKAVDSFVTLLRIDHPDAAHP